MKIEIIKENSEYQYSFYKIGEVWVVKFEFDEYYIAAKDNTYAAHSKAVKKSDCKIIE